jgi:hypothetical protein
MLKTNLTVKLVVSTAMCAVLVGPQAGFANRLGTNPKDSSHQPGDSLLLGNFSAQCTYGGSATVDSRKIVVGGHNQQVVHLSSSNYAQAIASIENLTTQMVIYSSPLKPLSFAVPSGSISRYFTVGVNYTAPHSSVATNAGFVPPNSPSRYLPGTCKLIVNNHGNYSVPFQTASSAGIPPGSRMNAVNFVQNANQRQCTSFETDFNQVTLNGSAIRFDTTAKPTSCDVHCER